MLTCPTSPLSVATPCACKVILTSVLVTCTAATPSWREWTWLIQHSMCPLQGNYNWHWHFLRGIGGWGVGRVQVLAESSMYAGLPVGKVGGGGRDSLKD
jgi:hypothetical protein